MAGWKFRHSSLDVERILQTMFNGEVDGAARQIADTARAELVALGHPDFPVTTDSHTSDRHVATVSIAHPAGLPVQAKHGVLTKAAAEHGYTVKDPK